MRMVYNRMVDVLVSKAVHVDMYPLLSLPFSAAQVFLTSNLGTDPYSQY